MTAEVESMNQCNVKRYKKIDRVDRVESKLTNPGSIDERRLDRFRCISLILYLSASMLCLLHASHRIYPFCLFTATSFIQDLMLLGQTFGV
jgi:hypothetical protein